MLFTKSNEMTRVDLGDIDKHNTKLHMTIFSPQYFDTVKLGDAYVSQWICSALLLLVVCSLSVAK